MCDCGRCEAERKREDDAAKLLWRLQRILDDRSGLVRSMDVLELAEVLRGIQDFR